MSTLTTGSEYRYREIRSVRDEGFTFHLVLQAVARFWTVEMRGRTRRDSPDSIMKWSRDWEYPWVLIESDIRPGQRVLDCGSGYSPLPFLWSSYGASVHAIDRDAVIASGLRYSLSCGLDLVRHAARFVRWWGRDLAARVQGNDEQRALAARAVTKIRRSAGYALGRMWRPDFWGPISPSLLRSYGVHYLLGDLTRLPHEDESFDVVTCVSVLEHMPAEAQLQGIAEMSRVLKPEGKLIITYDLQKEDLTERFITASGTRPVHLVRFRRPASVRSAGPDVIGLSLVKGGARAL